MKKLTRALCLLTAVCLSAGVTGCDKLKSSIPVFSELGDGGYIKPYNMFVSTEDGEYKYHEKGDAYESILDSDMTDDEKLQRLVPMILDGDEFRMYTPGGAPGTVDYTFGSWNENDDKLELTYTGYSIQGQDGIQNTVYADADKNEELDLHQRRINNCMSEMEAADEDDTLIGYTGVYNDIKAFIRYPYIKCGDHWKKPATATECSCLINGDYILAEQRGLAFKGDVLKNEFTIVYDSMLAEPDEYDESTIEQEIVFSADNTYDTGFKKGEWRLYGDNLLIMYPPEDSKGFAEFLYIDRDSKEIYMPLYVKCSGVEKLAK